MGFASLPKVSVPSASSYNILFGKNDLVRGADTELDSVQKVYGDNWEAL